MTFAVLCTRRYFLVLCRGRGRACGRRRRRHPVALRLSTTGDPDAAAPLTTPSRLSGAVLSGGRCRVPQVPLRLLLLLLLGCVHPAWDLYQTLQLSEAWKHSPQLRAALLPALGGAALLF